MKKMMVLLFVLGGCTSNHYSPTDQDTDKVLADCKTISFKKYNDAHSSDNKSGAIVGGVIFGPLGAVMVDAISGEDNSQQKIDLNFEIENCMKKHGYSGVSNGYN